MAWDFDMQPRNRLIREPEEVQVKDDILKTA